MTQPWQKKAEKVASIECEIELAQVLTCSVERLARCDNSITACVLLDHSDSSIRGAGGGLATARSGGNAGGANRSAVVAK